MRRNQTRSRATSKRGVGVFLSHPVSSPKVQLNTYKVGAAVKKSRVLHCRCDGGSVAVDVRQQAPTRGVVRHGSKQRLQFLLLALLFAQWTTTRPYLTDYRSRCRTAEEPRTQQQAVQVASALARGKRRLHGLGMCPLNDGFCGALLRSRGLWAAHGDPAAAVQRTRSAHPNHGPVDYEVVCT